MHTVKKYTQSYIQQLKECYKIQIYVNKKKESFQQNLNPFLRCMNPHSCIIKTSKA